jgi:hypothetical protein
MTDIVTTTKRPPRQQPSRADKPLSAAFAEAYSSANATPEFAYWSEGERYVEWRGPKSRYSDNRTRTVGGNLIHKPEKDHGHQEL